MTEILGLDKSLEIVMGGRRMNVIVFPLLLVLLIVTLVADSSLFSMGEEGIRLQKPSAKRWSDKTYAMVVGACTILGTLAFAYLLSVVMAPMLAQRYLYPLSAVAIMMLVIGSSRLLEQVTELENLDIDLVVAGVELGDLLAVFLPLRQQFCDFRVQ